MCSELEACLLLLSSQTSPFAKKVFIAAQSSSFEVSGPKRTLRPPNSNTLLRNTRLATEFCESSPEGKLPASSPASSGRHFTKFPTFIPCVSGARSTECWHERQRRRALLTSTSTWTNKRRCTRNNKKAAMIRCRIASLLPTYAELFEDKAKRRQ